MSNTQKNASYLFLARQLKRLLDAGKLTEEQYRQINMYNAKSLGATAVFVR